MTFEKKPVKKANYHFLPEDLDPHSHLWLQLNQAPPDEKGKTENH